MELEVNYGDCKSVRVGLGHFRVGVGGSGWAGGQSDGEWKVARDQGLYVVQKGNGYFDSEGRGSVWRKNQGHGMVSVRS